ncbi:MAG: PAS domain-containing protein [Candidatus Acidiferrales bacterium]
MQNLWIGDPALLPQPREQLLGRHVEDLVFSGVLPSALLAVQDVLRSGLPRLVEFDLHLPSGYRWLRAEILAVSAQDQPVAAVHAIIRDATHLKSASEKLRRQDSVLQQSIDIADLGTWEMDLSTKIVAFSDSALRMLGLGNSARRLALDQAFLLFHPADRRAIQHDVNEAIARNRSFDILMRYVHPDSGTHTLYVGGVPLQDPAGRVARIVGVTQDVTAKRRQQERRHKTEILFAQAQELGNLGSWEYSIKSRSFTWSPHLFRMFGLPPEDAPVSLDRACALFHPDDRARVWHDVETLCVERRPVENVVRFVLPDGSIRVFSSRAIPVENLAGEVTLIRGMSQDITERHTAEEQLRQTHALLAEAHKLAQIITWEADLKTGELTPSRELCELLGVDPDSTPPPQRLFWGLVHPDDRAMVDRDNANAIAFRRPFDHEVRYPLPDGSLRIVHSCAVPVLDESGNAVRLIGVSQDVTASRQAEDRLRKNEELLTHAEQIAGMGSWEMDLRTLVVAWSHEAYRMHKIDPADGPITREIFWNLMHPDDRPRVREITEAAIAARRPFEHSARYILSDGNVRIHFVRAVPFTDKSGQVVRLIGIFQDVTDRRNDEEDLRQLSQQLMQLRDQEQRRMARELHETAAQSAAALKMTLARISESLPAGDDTVHALLRSARILADDTIREIRTVSYLMHPPTLDRAGLGSALRWYADGFSRRSGVHVSIDVAEDFPRFSQEIETTVFRIVQEALTNVHRHSGSATAAIRLALQHNRLCVEIEDHGRGMALPSAATAGPAPLGVGLAGLRERVKQLKGSAEISSAPGKGTVIRVFLPISERRASGV